jgi:LysM repeat protein
MTPIQTTPTMTIAPMPEPSLVPTPFFYIVEDGDTLFGIAGSFNTTLEEILALNPQLGSDVLMIGERLILPFSPTPTPLVSEVADPPLQATIENIGVYETPTGGLWIVGEVRNDGERPIEDVQVEVIVKSSRDELLTFHAWVTPNIILAGGEAPFGILVDDVEESFELHTVKVMAGRPLSTNDDRLADLAVTDAEVTIDDGLARISGVLRNTGLETAVQIRLVTTLYDGAGIVTGYHELRLIDPLAAGATYTFRVATIPPGGHVATHTFIVQGLRQSEIK